MLSLATQPRWVGEMVVSNSRPCRIEVCPSLRAVAFVALDKLLCRFFSVAYFLHLSLLDDKPSCCFCAAGFVHCQ